MTSDKMKKITDTVWEIPRSFKNGMRVPARIYATEKLLNAMEEGVFEQITNVATLPGIVEFAICMPDGHYGYGFPIGGVAAFDSVEGIISPGGIGFDINCGMRLVNTSLSYEEVKPMLEKLVDKLFYRIPAGVGGKGMLSLSKTEFCTMVEDGMNWCLKKGYAYEDDLRHTEENGCMKGADASVLSKEAIERGLSQVGSLGSGNHYLEIQVAKPENIFDRELAEKLGITMPNQILIMIHTGSRGFGHQVASDYLKSFLSYAQKEGINLRDRELAYAPFQSKEGQRYFSAMQCAVNMAFVNRQLVLHRIREVFSEVFGKDPSDLGLNLIYDITHNTAKLERHTIDGREKELVIHRKGATRAFAPGMGGIPYKYRKTGQPVIIGGSMETGSYLLVGMESGREAFYTTAHGSGRRIGRRKAKKAFKGKDILSYLKNKGVYVRAVSMSGLAEEVGEAYKNIDQVAEATELAGLSRRVVKLIPIGNIKG
ncbi:MAG: RNA-splicing ligase RtcB [Spirochaetes bacterium]|nr:MAG: RNA-splicing ligase RtcB [Spirochaetota bacterium]